MEDAILLNFSLILTIIVFGIMFNKRIKKLEKNIDIIFKYAKISLDRENDENEERKMRGIPEIKTSRSARKNDENEQY